MPGRLGRKPNKVRFAVEPGRCIAVLEDEPGVHVLLRGPRSLFAGLPIGGRGEPKQEMNSK
jgi:hypothetical protein